MQYIGQQRGIDARVVVFVLFLATLLVAGLIALTFVDIPAPQTPITKALDAKAFLENK